MLILFAALFFTVVLLVTTTYFIMGGLPLLVLDHSTPLDGRFIRRFFEVYCTAALVAAVGAAISYTLSGYFWFALGTSTIMVVVAIFRKTIIPTMQRLTEQIQHDPGAVLAFRKIHAAALLVNLAQLVLLVWGVIELSFWLQTAQSTVPR